MTRKLTMAAAILAFGVATTGGAGIAQAKHGSDDPPHHHVRDDHGGARHHALRHHHRRGDDGPNHS